MTIEASRVQSPSSINLFKQCPRKYYYRYIAKMPTKPNIYTCRGSVVHSVLEDFFDINIKDNSLVGDRLLMHANDLLKNHWDKELPQMEKLGLEKPELEFYYQDSMMMVNKWVMSFLKKLNIQSQQYGGDLCKAFNDLTPIREEKYQSSNYFVMGFIDAIETYNGKIRVMDYKTSKKDQMTDEYRLQLAIYALLYKEKHGKIPDEVGLYLLKHGERILQASEEMVKDAQFELEQIHASTLSKNIADYPKNVTPLCKWSSGQCDFYDVCFAKSIYDL